MRTVSRGFLSSIVLLALVTGLFVFGVDVPRHLDPAVVGGSDPLPGEIAALYGELFDAIGEENYSRALTVLAQGMEVEALPETRLILDRYNELLLTEISSLDGSQVYLGEAAEYLRYVQIEESDDALLRSIAELGSANHTLGLLFEASIQLGNRLNIPQDDLVDDLRQAAGVLELYYDEYASLNQEKDTTEGLLEDRLLSKTLIMLTDVSDSVLIGDLVYLRGHFGTVEGVGLSRELGFYLDGVYIGKAVSDSDGDFYVGFPAPMVYSGEVSVWAEFWPSGADVDRYTPTRSNQYVVDVRYHEPMMEVEYSDAAYPGLPFEVLGILSYSGVPLEGFQVNLVDGVRNYTMVSGGDGGFRFNVTVPEDIDSYSFSVSSAPKGVYGPSSADFIVPVETFPVNLSLSTSWLSFGGGYLVVKGAVSSVGDGDYLVSFQGEPGRVSVVSDGEFSLRVPLGFSVGTGWNRYSVRVESSLPWVGGAVVSGRFFSVNPLIPLFLAVAASYLYIYREQVRLLIQREPVIAPVVGVEPVLVDSSTGLGLLLERVRGVLGVSVEPSMTLREFLGDLSGKIGDGLADSVRVLVLAYERLIYGPSGESDVDLDEMSEEIAGRLVDED